MSLEMSMRDGERRFALRLDPLLVPPSGDGLFPPGSIIRTVYADASVTLGSGRALLLQLAHPAIAAGVHDHSDYQTHPLDRLLGTLAAVSAVVFGSRAEAERIGEVLQGVHARVTGPGYRALDPDLLCWVNATLLDTATLMYERTIRHLGPGELDQLARDSCKVGEVFGCPTSRQPATWAEFRSYWSAGVDGLDVTAPARRVAGSLLAGKGLPARPAWLAPLALARAVTAALLPPRIRDDYRLPWRVSDRVVAATVLGGSRMVLPRTPVRWRQLGPELFRAAPSAAGEGTEGGRGLTPAGGARPAPPAAGG